MRSLFLLCVFFSLVPDLCSRAENVPVGLKSGMEKNFIWKDSIDSAVARRWKIAPEDNVAEILSQIKEGDAVEFLPGVHQAHFNESGRPPWQIQVSNVAFYFSPGSSILVSASKSPEVANDRLNQYVFYAERKTGIRFYGHCSVEGGRGNRVDPRAGFLKAIQCSDLQLDGLTFINFNNSSRGVIYFDSWNGKNNDPTRKINITNCVFKRCSEGIFFRNVSIDVTVRNNKFYVLDLSNINHGESISGQLTYLGRAIKIVGYVSASPSENNKIDNLKILDNFIEGATYGIEIWNQDEKRGRNPAKATNIEVSGNNIKALSGIGVNSFSSVKIHHNLVERLVLTDAQIKAYDGYSFLKNTSLSSTGALIEARPGYDFHVWSNKLNGNYHAARGLNLSASIFGIALGTPKKKIPCQAIVRDNDIYNCYAGLHISNTQNTEITNNRIGNNMFPVEMVKGENGFNFSKNVFADNIINYYSQTNSGRSKFIGDWEISRNLFSAIENPISNAFIHLDDTDAVFYINDNKFYGFKGEAILDNSKESRYNGNYFEGAQSIAIYGAVSFMRRPFKNVKIGTETIKNCDVAYSWQGNPFDNDHYDVHKIIVDSNLKNLAKAKNYGVIFEIKPTVVIADEVN